MLFLPSRGKPYLRGEGNSLGSIGGHQLDLSAVSARVVST
jgi:hypothetical protein